MLLPTRVSADDFRACFISPAMFVPRVGARDEATSADLAAAFKRGDYRNVRSVHCNSVPDQTRAAPATVGGFPHPKSPNPRFFASHCSLPLASLRA
jgi:hypothetical protein